MQEPNRVRLPLLALPCLALLLAGACTSSPTPHPSSEGASEPEGGPSFVGGEGGEGLATETDSEGSPSEPSAGPDSAEEPSAPEQDTSAGGDDMDVVAAEDTKSAGEIADPDGGPDDAADPEPDSHDPPSTVTVQELQTGAVPIGAKVVLPGVVVTGVAVGASSGEGFGLFVQDKAGGESSGLWVHTQKGSEAFAVGDLVTVSGHMLEYDHDGQWPDTVTEIDTWPLDSDEPVGGVAKTGLATPPEPHLLAPALWPDPAALEPWEGALVRVEGVTVDDPDLDFGEWSLEGDLLIDDKLFAFSEVFAGDTFESIVGVLDYSWGAFKVQPRSAEDFAGWQSSVVAGGSVAEGALIISEIMIDPGLECADADDEYIELHNTTAGTLDLEGLAIHWGESSHTVEQSVLVPGGGYALAVKEAPSPCYGHEGDLKQGLQLTNSGKVLTLEAPGGVVLDSVDFTDWASITSGSALGVDPTKLSAADNDPETAWCQQTTALASDFGTPGAPNDPCTPD